jgi:hypothetical protein
LEAQYGKQNYDKAHKEKKKKEERAYLRKLAENDPLLERKLRVEQELAAAKIQARYRGNQDRKSVEQMKEEKAQEAQEAAATIIQARYRGNQSRQKACLKKHERAASKQTGAPAPRGSKESKENGQERRSRSS